MERELKRWLACGVADATYLFPSRKRQGQPLDRRVVNIIMNKYLHSVGIARRYTPHCLRHTLSDSMKGRMLAFPLGW